MKHISGDCLMDINNNLHMIIGLVGIGGLL